MNNNNLIQANSSIQSYIDINRDKIDESLVSLRFMKEIDTFLDTKNISNKSLAMDLGCSESFISQLMSGVKKINTSFINKFEKNYNVKIKFSIESDEQYNFIYKSSKSTIIVSLNISSTNSNNPITSKVFKNSEYVNYEGLSTCILQ